MRIASHSCAKIVWIMESPKRLLHYTIASAVFLALFAGNLFVLQTPFVGIPLLVGFFVFFGWRLGVGLQPQEDTLGHVVWGGATLMAILSLYGTAAYYLDFLNQTTVAVGVILTPLLVFILTDRQFLSRSKTAHPRPSFSNILRTHLRPNLFLLLSLVLLCFSAINLLLQNPITSPVRSPWLLIPPVFFLAVFLIAWMTSAKPNPWLTVVFFFLTVSVALLAYPLGYGFDTFIHKATEQHIFDFGTITPKPLYYIGQYALVIFAAHGFSLPVALADTLLVPLLACVLLPLGAYLGFRSWLGASRAAPAALALFLVPLGSCIATTPQGLANIWTLLVVCSSLPMFDAQARAGTRARPYVLPVLFTIAALATHPLAGIPAVIYLGVLFLSRLPSRTPLYLFSFFSFFSLPLIFLANATISGLAINVGLNNIGNISWTDLFQVSLFFQNRFHPFLDLAYLFGWNRIVLLLALAAVGIIILQRGKRGARRDSRLYPFSPTLSIFLLPPIILLGNYLILSTVLHFDFLIDYERQNYAVRAYDTAQFFLLPLLGLVTSAWFTSVARKPLAIRFGTSALTAIVLTSALYMSYPRHDNYEISRGFNVGQSDIDTVHYIHDQNTTVNYIVLANQAVSAAAMQEYGFLQYFHDNIFYYPIPTGGAMYQTYLAMVNTGPTKLKATEAMNLAGVDKAYFVVNDYWFLADKIIENAKREATSWTAIDNGATYVFVYER